jgi:predicted RNA methylase
MALRLSHEVLEVLDLSITDGTALHLPASLDRKLYVATNKALELAGGKWDRKAGAHVFAINAADAIDPILLTGEITNRKQDFQAFFTPAELAARVVATAEICADDLVLEPSAGGGALIRPALATGALVEACELDSTAAEKLRAEFALECRVHEQDFMTMGPTDRFDRVIMNPPFAKQQDALHVLHAVKMLRPGGRLVAIMSAAVTFRETAHYRAVRDLVDGNRGTCEHLPEGSFREAGTGVNTVLISFDVQRAA